MEEKLLAYYQSLVKPVEEWRPDNKTEYMLDGANVDANISKKRAHKTIMSESIIPNKNRLKLGVKKRIIQKKTTGGGDSGLGGSQNDNGLGLELGGEFEGGGYIIEAGNVISIESKALDSINKFAYNVIQHAVREHFDPAGDENENFNKMKKSLMNVLEKNASN